MTNENKQFEKNKIIKEEPKEIKSPNWFDKNKFKEILAIIDSSKFNYKNKIGEFKYTGIKNLVNNIKNDTISEIDAKKDLNALNKIKNVEIIKYKKRTTGHKKLLNLFNNLLNIILTDKTLKSQENENEKVESKKEENKDDYYENENEDENKDEDHENEDKDNENEYEKVESKKEENKDEDYENEDEDYQNEDEYENEDDETMSQKEKKEIIKRLNDDFDKIIDKSKSFEEEIKSLEKLENLNEYHDMHDYDNKELKLKIFKLQIARLSNNIVNEKLFEQIFGHTLIKLVDKLINRTDKEENQIIVKNINKNIDKPYGMDDLYDTASLILDFNETIQLDLV